jgi:hypothetical protein
VAKDALNGSDGVRANNQRSTRKKKPTNTNEDVYKPFQENTIPPPTIAPQRAEEQKRKLEQRESSGRQQELKHHNFNGINSGQFCLIKGFRQCGNKGICHRNITVIRIVL